MTTATNDDADDVLGLRDDNVSNTLDIEEDTAVRSNNNTDDDKDDDGDDDTVEDQELNRQSPPPPPPPASSTAVQTTLEPSSKTAANAIWQLPSRVSTGEPTIERPSMSNVISQLRQHIAHSRYISDVVLCAEIDHFSASWDRGWGCGWRNTQQFVSALSRLPTFNAKLWPRPSAATPPIPDLQKALENAWY